ncbi:GTP-binding nuclear protein [Psidium guajava]|nr:GTP-binding nuclear protein [Psidium guajava]
MRQNLLKQLFSHFLMMMMMPLSRGLMIGSVFQGRIAGPWNSCSWILSFLFRLIPHPFPSVLFLQLLLFKYGFVNESPIIPLGSPLLLVYCIVLWRYFLLNRK